MKNWKRNIIKVIPKSNLNACKPPPKTEENSLEKYLQAFKAKYENLEMDNGNLEKYSSMFQYKSYYKMEASTKPFLLEALQSFKSPKFVPPHRWLCKKETQFSKAYKK